MAIKAARLAAGLSREELAAKAGVTQLGVALLEAGLRPRADVQAVCAALGVPVPVRPPVEGWRIALLAAGLLYLYPFIGAVLAMERPRHRRVGAVACALLALLMVGAAFCFRNGPDGAAGPTYWFGSDTVFMVAVVMFMQYALLVGAGYVAGRIADMRDLRRSMPRLAACVALVCIAHFPLSHVV